MKYKQKKRKLRKSYELANKNGISIEKLDNRSPNIIIPTFNHRVKNLYSSDFEVIVPEYLSRFKPINSFPEDDSNYTLDWIAGDSGSIFVYTNGSGDSTEKIDFELNGSVERKTSTYYTGFDDFGFPVDPPNENIIIDPPYYYFEVSGLTIDTSYTWRLRYFDYSKTRWSNWGEYTTFNIYPIFEEPERITPVYAYYFNGGTPIGDYSDYDYSGTDFFGDGFYWSDLFNQYIYPKLYSKTKVLTYDYNAYKDKWTEHIYLADNYFEIVQGAGSGVGGRITGSSLELYGTGNIAVEALNGANFNDPVLKFIIDVELDKNWEETRYDDDGTPYTFFLGDIRIKLQNANGSIVYYDSGYKSNSFTSPEITVNDSSVFTYVRVSTGDLQSQSIAVKKISVKLTSPINYNYLDSQFNAELPI